MTETETVKTSNQEVLSARRNQNAKKHKTYTVLSRAPDADTNFRVSPPRKPSTQLRYRTRTNSEAARRESRVQRWSARGGRADGSRRKRTHPPGNDPALTPSRRNRTEDERESEKLPPHTRSVFEKGKSLIPSVTPCIAASKQRPNGCHNISAFAS